VPPSAPLARLIDQHWRVRWDLPVERSYLQEILPHPSINIVVEPEGTWVWGVPTHRASRRLAGSGWAFGAKLKPGAFTACTGIAAWQLTDARTTLHAAFGRSLQYPDLSRGSSPALALAAIEQLLAPHAQISDPEFELVNIVIETLGSTPPGCAVETIARRHHLSVRTLQRLFRRYVGVGPKWVLKRLRIHEATAELNRPEPPEWTELALRLGYYDHAHFIRDFRSIVGRSPARYTQEAAHARHSQTPSHLAGASAA
jgi:AraC-like DNA-binding protein